jgi:CheY-like chemotaxis protein
VVDDDPDILDSLKDVLEMSIEGVRVHTAPSGQAALDILSHAPVDLIITDYRMPGMNGAELIERAHEIAPDVPTVLMSAYAEATVRAPAGRSPSAVFIPKPMDMREFIQTSRRLLGSSTAA